jgi:uncharacterized cupin superfamily protein
VDRVRNLLTVALEDGPTESAPPGHDFAETSLTEPFGAVATGMSVYEIAPGNACWPYHFEANEEEWLIVIAGAVTLRTPEGETVLRVGDVACFPPGAAGAHAVRNHSDAPARVAMPSVNDPYGGATVYPDSGKVGVRAPGFRHRGRLGEQVEYWEGES